MIYLLLSFGLVINSLFLWLLAKKVDQLESFVRELYESILKSEIR